MTDLELEAQFLELEAQYFKDSIFQLGKDVAVRIEGKKHDEKFWSTVFQIALPNLKIEFYPQCQQYPSYGTTGRHCVLLLKDYADKELVLCVDSDSEYLLEMPILDNPFVFHTYVDSIENFWCYPKGFPEMVEKVMGTEGVTFDFTHFFETYSTIIYPYLLCSLFSTKQRDDLLKRAILGDNAGFLLKTDWTTFEEKLKLQYESLYNQYQLNASFEPFVTRLIHLGLTEKEAYLFVRGHDILDRVALPLIKSVVKSRFATLATSEEKIAYERQLKTHRYDDIFQNNPKMHNCAFYQRIVQDIQMAFQN